ncbi:MAG TPA: hypothetical protein VLA56_17920 [Pseudomonadales bacterium]|nr:hypothetical protein [Pseudomonadales bacterium]
MKLRILDDHIRLRLDRGEVERLARGEALENRTRFPDGAHLSCRLSTRGRTPAADFADGTIDVRMPAARVRAWAADETAVSLHAELPHAQGQGALSLLVEKDFECLAPRPGESQANRFTNPLRGTDRS